MEISRSNKEGLPVYNCTVHYVGEPASKKPYVIFGNGESITVFGDVNFQYTLQDCVVMYSTAADIALKNSIKVIVFNPTFG